MIFFANEFASRVSLFVQFLQHPRDRRITQDFVVKVTALKTQSSYIRTALTSCAALIYLTQTTEWRVEYVKSKEYRCAMYSYGRRWV